MAITDIIEESEVIDAGAPSIKYKGDRPLKKEEMKMAGPDWYIKRIEHLMYNFDLDYEEAGKIADDSEKYYEYIGHDPYESRNMDEEVVEEGIMRAAKGGVASQGGVKNYEPSKMVSVPKEFRARSHSPNTHLAYITDDEAGILQALKPDTPHKGPRGIPNYDSFDASGAYSNPDTGYSASSGGAGGGWQDSSQQDEEIRQKWEQASDQQKQTWDPQQEQIKLKQQQDKLKADQIKSQEQNDLAFALETTKKAKAKQKENLKKKVNLDLLTDEDTTELEIFDTNKDGKIGPLEKLSQLRTNMAKKTLTNSAAQKLGMMPKTMVPSFLMSDTMRKTPPGVTTEGLDEILGVEGRDLKTGIGTMEDPFEVDYSMSQYGLKGKDLTRARDQIDVAMQDRITQDDFDKVYGNKPPVDTGGGGEQDPCKGPNPPAYCFTGGKNQTDEEVVEEEWEMPLAFRAEGGRVGLQEGGPPIANSVQQYQPLQPQASQYTTLLGGGQNGPMGPFGFGGGLGGQRPVFPRLTELEQGVGRAEQTLGKVRKRLGNDPHGQLGISHLGSPLGMLMAARPAYQRPNLFLQQANQGPSSFMQMNMNRGAGLQNDEERIGRAYGGMMGDDGRRAYGLGSIFKKAKKIFKSPLGKAALLGLGGWKMGLFGGGGGSSFLSKLGPMSGWFGKKGALSKIGLGKISAGIGGISLATALLSPPVDDDGDGYDDKTGFSVDEWRKKGAQGSKEVPIAFRAEGGDAESGLMNLGGMEKDYREDGGFVPIGKKERADDVPARLSKNEFVFTADAVKNAGDGDIDKGAEVMYNIMKNLEAGGDISQETQGLDGAREMFQTSQRLEEVL